jgi:O-antigen/teichoic acid export membrane protein
MVRGVVLARILHPLDYGIVGAALMLQQMLQQFGEMGIGSAAVHLQKKAEEILPVALIMRCCFGLLLAGVIFLMAPFWANFFGRAEVASVTRFTALFVLAGVLTFPSSVQAQISLRFKEFSIPTVVATATGCIVAIVLVLTGFGYWSIVWGILTTRLVEAVLLIRAFPWKVKFAWDRELARELWRYGYHIVGAATLTFIILQVDNLMVGKLLGLTALGYYVLAFRWANFGSKTIASGIGSVLFPTFSHWRAEGRNPVEKFETIMRMSAILYVPISLGMLVIAPEFVRIALGEKWLPAVVPMQVLCAAAIFRSVGNQIAKLLLALGRPDLDVRFQAGFLATLLVLLVPFTLWFGVLGASLSVLIAAIAWYFLVRVVALRRVTGLGFTTIGRALLPSLTASGFMAAGILVAKALHGTTAAGPAFLALLVGLGGVLYTSTIFILLGKELRLHLRPAARGISS